jgi:hypothetical protein
MLDSTFEMVFSFFNLFNFFKKKIIGRKPHSLSIRLYISIPHENLNIIIGC